MSTEDIIGDGSDDICGYCGKPGAEKLPLCSWPNQDDPQSEYVHAECENKAAQEAMDACSQQERDNWIYRGVA